MECDLNGFQRIRYVNGNVDILYSCDVSFAVQYTCSMDFIAGNNLECEIKKIYKLPLG